MLETEEVRNDISCYSLRCSDRNHNELTVANKDEKKIHVSISSSSSRLYGCCSDGGIQLEDERTLENLLTYDDQQLVSPSYFRFQCDLKTNVRKMVVTWMLEVCEDQRCHDEIFWVSVNYFDRLLCVLPVKRNQLQLIAAVCLFIASKFYASSSSTSSANCIISARHLAMYTDNSVTVDEILEWELVVLQALKWNVSTATPYDFLHQFFIRLPLTEDQIRSIHRHATTLVTLATTDEKFVVCPASMLASGCLCAAAKGLLGCQWLTDAGLHQQLHQLTSVDIDCLVACQEQIEELLKSSLAEAAAGSASTPQIDSPYTVKHHENKTTSSDDPSAPTPTDVREITVWSGMTSLNDHSS